MRVPQRCLPIPAYEEGSPLSPKKREEEPGLLAGSSCFDGTGEMGLGGGGRRESRALNPAQAGCSYRTPTSNRSPSQELFSQKLGTFHLDSVRSSSNSGST